MIFRKFKTKSPNTRIYTFDMKSSTSQNSDVSQNSIISQNSNTSFGLTKMSLFWVGTVILLGEEFKICNPKFLRIPLGMEIVELWIINFFADVGAYRGFSVHRS